MVQKHISICFAFVAVLATTFGPAHTHALTCTSALTYLLPCQPFLVENGQLTASCCRGINDLRQAVSASFSRPLCLCIKQAAKSAKIVPMKVQRVMQFCNTHLPLPVNPNVHDCNLLRTKSDSLRPEPLKDFQL